MDLNFLDFEQPIAELEAKIDELRFVGDDAKARLKLGAEWSVRPSRELRDKLSELLGSNNVRLLYAPAREIM